ncbi:MAG: redox-sensing transcriptional repressor Rex, partial [Chloroflexi bacterium]|nr:redox-sensing transcriptional repressor Rex [Chloroflexota bacterium]
RQWGIAVVGVGNLGRALLGYKGFLQQGFELVAAFDVDPQRVGSQIEGVEIYHLDQLTEIAAAKTIKLAMIAVPAPAAQQVADRIVAAGLEGVVNFAPVTITLPDHISQVGVDLAIELEQLAFSALKRNRL